MATRLFNLTWLKTQTGRDLDEAVDSSTLALGEKADGTQGAFTFFQGIKNFFKGVTALGSLTSSGKIPVLNTSTGAVNYVTVESLSNVVSGLITTNTVEAGNSAPVSSKAVNQMRTSLVNQLSPVNTISATETKAISSKGVYDKLHITSAHYDSVGLVFDFKKTGNVVSVDISGQVYLTSNRWNHLIYIPLSSGFVPNIQLDVMGIDNTSDVGLHTRIYTDGSIKIYPTDRFVTYNNTQVSFVCHDSYIVD